MRDDRPRVCDAQYGEAANDQIDWQESKSCKIGRAVAEIDGRAERAPDESSRDPDPVPAERGGKTHGWKIRGEEYVRPDQGKTPPHRGRQSNAGCCKSDTEKRRRLRCSLPAPPKFVDQFHHGSHQTVQRKPNKAKHRGKYAANVVGQKFSWFSQRVHQESFCAETTLESWISSVLSNPKFAKRASQRCKRTSDFGTLVAAKANFRFWAPVGESKHSLRCSVGPEIY